MSEDQSLLKQDVEATNNLTLLLTVLAIVGGLGLFFLLRWLGEGQGIHAGPWWTALGTRAVETLMGVGALGFLFELFFRRRLISEVVERQKLLFAVDRSFAARLSTAVKKQLVLNTLKAHLGEDNLAQAIYTNLLERYFEIGSSLTRYHLNATIVVSDLENDITITHGKPNGSAITLSREHYYGLQLRMEYKMPFSAGRSVVGVILSEEPKELSSWFANDKCLFRHFFLLPEQQRKDLLSLLSKKESCSNETLKTFFNLSVRIGRSGNEIPIDNLSLSDSGESVVVFLNQEALLRAKLEMAQNERTGLDEVLHSIELNTCIPKEARLYPYLIGDPHKNPNFRFHYAGASGITRVIPLVNFSGEAANAVSTTHNDKAKYAEVVTTGEEVWVFPNSSVVFRWSL